MKKVLNFSTNEVLWKISSCNKKSYHFETLFSRTFLYKKVPGKSPVIVENVWEQWMLTTIKKGQLILKNTPGYIQMQIHRKNPLLDLIFIRIRTFFFFFSSDIIFFRTLIP